MIVQASVTGLFKTILIIIGALVALRFFGRLMIARRNLEEERELLRRERAFSKERNDKLRNFGKVSVTARGEKTPAVGKVEDVDFEEIG